MSNVSNQQFTPFNPPLKLYPEGALLPKLDDAVRRLQRCLQAPFPMIASSAIGAIALACQRGYLVERKPGLVFPIGLAFLTMAAPSERKSSTDRRFLKPIREFESRIESQTAVRIKEWRAFQAILNAKKAGISRVITKLIAHGEDTAIHEQQLATLLKTASEKPKHTRLIVNDADAEAILSFIRNYGGSCGVMVNEGAIFFDSKAAKHAGLFAQLWSGDDIRHDGTNEDSFTIVSPRLTMSIMVPPAILQAFLANKGKFWRDSGLLARFLVSYPLSTMGSRYENVNFPVDADLSSYDARILDILSSAPCDGSCENVLLRFEESARRLLAEFANIMESHLSQFGFLSDISDAASKIAENAARMAAVFHIFEGYDGLIMEDTLRRAIAVCDWHLSEFKRLFGQYPQVSTVIQDAEEIVRCIKVFYEERGYSESFPKSRISRYATEPLRKDPVRREAAFNLLIQNNRIQYLRLINDKTTYVVLQGPQVNPPDFKV